MLRRLRWKALSCRGPGVTTMNEQSTSTFNADALASATDLLKTLTGYATGALVVSAGLVTVQGISFVPWVKVVLALSWVMLFFSAACGVAAQSYVPRLIKKRSADINDRSLKNSTKAMQGLFVLGILGLAITFASMLFTTVQKPEPKVNRPAAALTAAYNAVCPAYRSDAVQTIEFVNNADSVSGVWHVRLSGGVRPNTFDVYVDADGATPVVYPHVHCQSGRGR